MELLVVGGVFPGLLRHAGGPIGVRVELYATPGDDEPLWSDTLPAVAVGPGGSAHLVLGVGVPLPAEVFARYPRYLSVAADGEAATGPRVPLTGAEVRHAARLVALEGGGSSERLDEDTRRMLARLPSRLRTLGEGFTDLHVRLVAIENKELQERDDSAVTARLRTAEHRLHRVEDQVEDLVGPPHGEVVALAGRVTALEAQVVALGAAVARLAEALSPAGPGRPDDP